VDGNAAYRYDKHANILQSMDKYNLLMIEQPFATNELVDHAELQKYIETPICMDESIESIEHLRTAIILGACRIVNIKPGRIGGLLESIKIHDMAAAHNIGVWCGGLLETGIGRAFNIALASKENFIYPADMSPYHFYYAEDLVNDSFEVKSNGCVDVPDKPGLGFDISDPQIEKFTTKKVVVSGS
jgi:O-succinylbenzoate synthase